MYPGTPRGRLRRVRLEDLEQLLKEGNAVAASKKLEKRREIVARILAHRIRIDVITAELVREGRAERPEQWQAPPHPRPLPPGEREG